MTERLCEECGAPLVRRKQERSHQFKRRRWCSRKCGAQPRRLKTPEQLSARQEARRATWRRYHDRHKAERNAATAARIKARGAAARRLKAEIAAASAERRAEMLAMAEFLARKNVIRCPTRYAAPSEHAALNEREAAPRLAAMKPTDHSSEHWKRRRQA